MERLLEIAQEYGTASFVYDADAFASRCQSVKSALGCRLCYCMKANPFLLASLPDTVSSIEVCSPGELELCIRHRIPPGMIFLSGVYKDEAYVARALAYGVSRVTVESLGQLELLASLAKGRKEKIPVFLRLTAGDQFGLSREDLLQAAGAVPAGLELTGLHFFSGTQKTKASRVEAELGQLTDLAKSLGIRQLEYGPGFAVDYFGSGRGTDVLEASAPAIRRTAEDFDLTIELGRYLAAPCGVYLTKVVDVKENGGKRYAITDGGVHHLSYDGQVMGMRPVPLEVLGSQTESETVTICGSLCSLGDRLAQDVSLPRLEPGRVLAFAMAGGYCAQEGPALFLCRDLPQILLLKGGTVSVLRSRTPTYSLFGKEMP